MVGLYKLKRGIQLFIDILEVDKNTKDAKLVCTDMNREILWLESKVLKNVKLNLQDVKLKVYKQLAEGWEKLDGEKFID